MTILTRIYNKLARKPVLSPYEAKMEAFRIAEAEAKRRGCTQAIAKVRRERERFTHLALMSGRGMV